MKNMLEKVKAIQDDSYHWYVIPNELEEQKFYKRMRKEARLIIEGGKPHWNPFHPSEAQWKHAAMRKRLRLIYAAYGIARGKSLEYIENNHKEEVHPLEQYMDLINDRIDKYKIQVPVEVVE